MEIIRDKIVCGKTEQAHCKNKRINPYNAEGTFAQSKKAKIFEKHLNHVMLVLIGKLSLSTFR